MLILFLIVSVHVCSFFSRGIRSINSEGISRQSDEERIAGVIDPAGTGFVTLEALVAGAALLGLPLEGGSLLSLVSFQAVFRAIFPY